MGLKPKQFDAIFKTSTDKVRGKSTTAQNPQSHKLSIVNYQLSITPAFTLIEILMVIVIVGILIAVLITGISALKGQTRIKQAQSMLEHLAAAETEYRAETGNTIHFSYDSYNTYDKNIDNNIDGSKYASIYTFFEYVKPYPKAYAHFKEVGKGNNGNKGIGNGAWGLYYNDSIYSNSNETPNIVLDPWGNPIQYRSYSNGDGPLGGNPVWPGASGNLPRHGSEDTPKSFFASAGPDGKWGHTDEDNKPDKQAKDNLYSYEVMK